MERSNGRSYGEISKKYGISRSTIQYMVKNDGRSKKKNGPKEKLSKGDKRRILALVNDSFTKKVKCSSTDIKNTMQLNVSKHTICRVLRRMNYNYKNVPSKFKLSYKMKQRRFEAAKEFLISGVQWNNVVFSDEKYFTFA